MIKIFIAIVLFPFLFVGIKTLYFNNGMDSYWSWSLSFLTLYLMYGAAILSGILERGQHEK